MKLKEYLFKIIITEEGQYGVTEYYNRLSYILPTLLYISCLFAVVFEVFNPLSRNPWILILLIILYLLGMFNGIYLYLFANKNKETK